MLYTIFPLSWVHCCLLTGTLIYKHKPFKTFNIVQCTMMMISRVVLDIFGYVSTFPLQVYYFKQKMLQF